jgi:hypothetical protein
VRIVIDGDALEVAGISRAEQRALISMWLRRHADD